MFLFWLSLLWTRPTVSVCSISAPCHFLRQCERRQLGILGGFLLVKLVIYLSYFHLARETVLSLFFQSESKGGDSWWHFSVALLNSKICHTKNEKLVTHHSLMVCNYINLSSTMSQCTVIWQSFTWFKFFLVFPFVLPALSGQSVQHWKSTGFGGESLLWLGVPTFLLLQPVVTALFSEHPQTRHQGHYEVDENI